jgi:hypothetical protein
MPMTGAPGAVNVKLAVSITVANPGFTGVLVYWASTLNAKSEVRVVSSLRDLLEFS